jgi:hypothetical protein
LVQCRSSVVGTSFSNVDDRHGSFGDKRTFFRAQPFKLPSLYLQKSFNGAALNCVYLVVRWIDRWPSQS